MFEEVEISDESVVSNVLPFEDGSGRDHVFCKSVVLPESGLDSFTTEGLPNVSSYFVAWRTKH